MSYTQQNVIDGSGVDDPSLERIESLRLIEQLKQERDQLRVDLQKEKRKRGELSDKLGHQEREIARLTRQLQRSREETDQIRLQASSRSAATSLAPADSVSDYSPVGMPHERMVGLTELRQDIHRILCNGGMYGGPDLCEHIASIVVDAREQVASIEAIVRGTVRNAIRQNVQRRQRTHPVPFGKPWDSADKANNREVAESIMHHDANMSQLAVQAASCVSKSDLV